MGTQRRKAEGSTIGPLVTHAMRCASRKFGGIESV